MTAPQLARLARRNANYPKFYAGEEYQIRKYHCQGIANGEVHDVEREQYLGEDDPREDGDQENDEHMQAQ